VQLARKPTNLDEIVQSAMESVLPQSFKKNLQLTSNSSPQVQRVTVDADKIRQCVVNLLSNSVKFTPAGGHISVQAALRSGRRRTPGLSGTRDTFQNLRHRQRHRHSPRAAGKVFETFFQADSSASREYGGAGRGSPSSRATSRAHGGEVSVRSDAGKGSTFTMVLPVEPPGTGLGCRRHRARRRRSRQ